jgi:signal transduction histidine kinase
LYAVPLLGAALVWPPRAVIAFLALTAITIGVSFLAVGAPTTLERVRLVGLVLIGGLTIQTARLRVAAEAAGRARDDFVAAAAHDLKNPLTVIRGEAQHLRTQLQRQAAAPVPAGVSEPWGAPGAPGAPGTYGDRLHTGLLTGLGRIDRAAGHTLALLNGLLDVVMPPSGPRCRRRVPQPRHGRC